MNVYDSARMADVLAPLGYEQVDAPQDADLVILNTCHIREKAAEKVYSELGRLRQHKERRKESGDDMLIAVGGCVGQAEGTEMMSRAPVVDMVFGPQTYHRLPEMVTQASRKRGQIIEVDFPTEDKFDALPANRSEPGWSAFLTIQEGCDKFCTFCVVPYTRGAEFSRPVLDIVREAEELASSGVQEITLLGQNVNAFHGEGPGNSSWGLGRLIRRLADIDGIERLRYTTSHPRDMDDELITAHRDVPALMPYLHLPVQSGSDRILQAMNRQHTADEYRWLVDRIRNARPDIALSSDFIVGFPGETASDFEETLKLVRDVFYAQAYSFKYSARPGTPATSMYQIDEGTKDGRLAELQALLADQQESFNESVVGQTLDILFVEKGRQEGQLVGRSPYFQAVHAQLGEGFLGKSLPISITSKSKNSLSGTPHIETVAGRAQR